MKGVLPNNGRMIPGFHFPLALVLLGHVTWTTSLTVLFRPLLQSKVAKVRRGTSLVLQCDVNAETSQVTWYKNGGVVASVTRFDAGICDWKSEDINLWIECSNTTVMLTVLKVNDVGVWKCEDAITNKISDPVNITFHYGQGSLKPSLTVSLRSIIPGSTLDLDCKVNINVKRVIWYHNDVSVADIDRHINGSCRVVWHKDARFQTQCEGNSSRLLVNDVMASDGHAWYCYDSTHHVKSNKVHVQVLTATEKPVLVTSQEVARFGSRMNLTCVLPYISPLVRWTANDQDFGDATVQFIGGCKFQSQKELPIDFNFTCDKETVSIAFMALSEQNTTKWKCQDPYRKLISPEAEVKVSLPSIWPMIVEINGYKGSTTDQSGMTLTCTSLCDHRFDFRWHFGNMTASASHSVFDSTQYRCSQTLTLHPDWTYHGRVVRCLVTNTITKKAQQGRVSLQIKYPPIPKVSLEFQEESDGNIHPVLVCRVRANPREVVFSSWKHMYNGVLIRSLQGLQNEMESTLSIPEPSYRDEGVYVCSVSNSVVTQTGREPIPSQIIFKPQGAPEFLDSDVLSKQMLNSSVTLTHRFITDSNFVKVTWLYNGDRLTMPSSGYEETLNKSIDNLSVYGRSVEREVYDVTLTIDDVSSMTYGVYVLEVCNNLGCITTKDIYIHYDKPEEEDDPEGVEVAVVSSLGYVQILAFSVGLVVLIFNILLIIFVLRRRRTLARRITTTQVTPDVVNEAAVAETTTDDNLQDINLKKGSEDPQTANKSV